VIGMASACETSGAAGLVSSKTSVWSSGVRMPGMSRMLPGDRGAPLMSLKYASA
jgi:hypothetical protein